MLTAEVDIGRLVAQQEIYTNRGTMAGRDLAYKVSGLREAFRHSAKRFNERQEGNRKNGKPVLGDGRMSTLERFVLMSPSEPEWPVRMGAMFRGLHLSSALVFPSARKGVLQALRGRHAPIYENWVARLDDAPPGERDFAPVTALACYFDSLKLIRIFWAGAEADFEAARLALLDATLRWRDWSRVYPRFRG